MSWWQARSPRAFAAAAATAWIALLGACSTSPADLGDATLADAALAAQDGSVEAADTSVPSPDAAAPSPDAGLEAPDTGASGRDAASPGVDVGIAEADAGHVVPPSLVPGGGVTDRFIRGVLHVHVIDEQTETPVAGALVQLGGGAATSEPSATTDASGRVTFQGIGIDGPQTVTATAVGYAATTWIGVDGVNVTLPLARRDLVAPPSATLRGTVTGWDEVPVPPPDHFTYVVVVGSAPSLFRPYYTFPQGTNEATGTQADACLKAAFIDTCDWKYVSRAGPQFLVGIGLDFDGATGVTTHTGYSFATGLDPAAGATVEGIALEPVPAPALVPVAWTMPAAPAGLTAKALAILDMGPQGQVGLGAGLAFGIPAPTGQLAGAEYHFFAMAEEAWDKEAPRSISYVRHVADLGQPVTFPEWLAVPSGLAAEGGLSFTPAAEADYHTVELRGSTGSLRWTVVLLDGSSSFALPEVTPDPLPQGQVSMRVNAFDVPGLDTRDFSLAGIRDTFSRTSVGEALVTR